MTEELEGMRIALIGGGAMGEALAAGLLSGGHARERLSVADPDPARREHLEREHGIRAESDPLRVATEADLLVLAVKPGIVTTVLARLGALEEKAQTAPLWVSIAAGVRLAVLEANLPKGARVVRAMPNTPALVRAGATAFVANEAASEADRAAARALFERVGLAWEAPNEGLLDAATGLSGSGPAYVFVLLEALSDAGVRMGLPRDAASALATQTVLGAAQLAQTSGLHPARLKDQVTSPGGTTIAGLERLEAAGFRAAIHAAVAAATRRSQELGG